MIGGISLENLDGYIIGPKKKVVVNFIYGYQNLSAIQLHNIRLTLYTVLYSIHNIRPDAQPHYTAQCTASLSYCISYTIYGPLYTILV